jgi:predicted ATPase
VAAVVVRLLGGFGAVVDDVAVGDGAWRLRKARQLVKMLALAPGHRLHREQVLDLLWRDREPGAALNNLHQAVHAARRALGADAIEVRDELLRLVADIDVDRFEDAAREARRARTQAAYLAALSLYCGEMLPEDRYEDWAAARRDELDELHAQLSAELAALGAERSRLPADVSSFIGRGRELGELEALLGGTRLLTLAGTGGVGKTRLALELARAVEPSFPDGVALVELAAVADRRFVADAVAAALDVRALAGQGPTDALVEFVAPRAMLLVLDNCEHVLATVARLVDAMLRGAPLLRIVATSREPLHVTGEVVFRVPSLSIPDPDRPHVAGELLGYEAARLFAERGAAASPGFTVDERNAADVARICFRLDGLPLALELAAGRLGALTPGAVAERLDTRFRLLRSGNPAAPTRQQTLAATLDWSHGLLAPEEQLLLRRLAVFAGGFALAAAEVVCADDRLAGDEIADVLARLTEKSLVAVDADGGDRRYRLLETIRMYAADRLGAAGETVALTARHAQWALALAEREGDAPTLDREAANLRAALDTVLAREPDLALRLCIALWPFWLRRIDLTEAHERFVEALAAVPGRSARRADALLAVAAFDYRAGALECGRGHVHESLDIAVELGDRRAEWRALQFLGGAAFTDDEPAAALEWFERARALAAGEGFAAAHALTVYSIGVAQLLLGDGAVAERLVAESVEAFRALAGSPERVPSPINVSERLTADIGARPNLRIVFEDTLLPFVELSSDTAIGYVLANQAQMVRARGDLARARALLAESAGYFERAGDERGRADVLVRHAYLELADGRIPAARSCLTQALEQRRRLNDRRRVGLVLQGLGLVETLAGDLAAAGAHLDEADELFRRAGDRWGLASTLWRRADVAFAAGDLDAAEHALQQAADVLRQAQRRRWIALTLASLAEVAVLRGDAERADTLLAEAAELFRAKHDALGAAAAEDRRIALAARGHREDPTS